MENLQTSGTTPGSLAADSGYQSVVLANCGTTPGSHASELDFSHVHIKDGCYCETPEWQEWAADYIADLRARLAAS